MKPTRVFATVAAACAVLFAIPALTHAPAHSYSTGAPPAFSGPEQYCNACHGGPGNEVNGGPGSVTIDAPDTFMPGETITVTVTVDNTAGGPLQGFEFSARDAALEHVGTLEVDGTTVQYAQGDPVWVTHTAESNTQTSWTFEWVAPADPPDEVTFYAAGNAANGNGFPDEGDEIYADEHVIGVSTVSNEPGAGPLSFRLDAPFPNPIRATATARYALERPAEVTARLLDGRGRIVRVVEQGPRGAGTHTLRFETADLPAGAYFLVLSTPEGTRVQPVSVVR